MKKGLLLFLSLLILATACKKEEEVALSEFGKIKGFVSEYGTDSLIYNANVFTTPATSYVTTDEKGEYTIYNVEPGEYSVTAAKTGYDTLTVQISVVADKTTYANFILHRTDTLANERYGKISGIVTDANTSLPIQNVVLRTSPPTVVLLSDQNGAFEFSRLTPAVYVLTAQKNGYDSVSVSVAVEAGYVSEANLVLTPSDTTTPPQYATLEGNVINAVTGEPVGKALITGSPSFGTFFTDSTGRYKIENLLPGDYQITVSKIYFQDGTGAITAQAGDNLHLDFALMPTVGNINGSVIDSTGAPIQDVIITTSPETGSFITDAQGKFTIENVSVGEVTINAEKSGYENKSVTITVEAGLTREVVIMLEKN